MATRRKRRTTTPGISKIGDDEDLVVEVLCRIWDPKTVFRCKSVCKRWNSLISAPYFSRRFRSHNCRIRSETESPPLLISSAVRGPFWSFLPLPSTETPSTGRVVDCFKDLLLLEFVDRSSQPSTRSYLVCNPFTKQWVALPSAPETDSLPKLARLVCKPLDLGQEEEEPLAHHFEYRFLVVRLHRLRPALDVFCSESGRWTEVALDVSIPWWDEYYNVVSLNGKLYWKNYRRQVVVGWNPFSCLDDESDNGRISPLAPTLIDVDYWQFGAAGVWSSSQGALHVIYPMHWRSRDGTLIVWRLLEEEEEEAGRGSRRWTRRYEVPLNKLIDRILKIKRWKTLRIRVVGQHLDKSEIIFLQCRAIRGRTWPIFSCNLKTEEVKPLVYRTEFIYRDSVFQPRITLWPTPIANYQKLRDSYDGRYNCWLQPNISQSTSQDERGK